MLDVQATEKRTSSGVPVDRPDDVVEVVNPAGMSDLVLVCEHASRHIPAEFADLGLTGDALVSHIAWDPGAIEVAQRLSAALDAPLVAQRISRLVYDCNRPPEAASAIPEKSEIYPVPGNAGLAPDARQARIERYYDPFRRRLAACLEGRIALGRPPAVVTVHTFTPVYFGARRQTEIGILHDADSRLADALIACAGKRLSCRIGRNEPYGPADGVTHTLREHALPRGLLNVMIEIRNDLVAEAAGRDRIAAGLAAALGEALAGFDRPVRSATGRETTSTGRG